MKKLKLKMNGIKDMLTKEQMKGIVAGYGGPSQYTKCCYGVLGIDPCQGECMSYQQSCPPGQYMLFC